MSYLRLIFVLLVALPALAQTISTIAGGGTGDGNAATQAYLNFPYSVAVDAQGNLFIADQNDHRIRKVTPQGFISTLAGSGVPGFADGPAAQAQFNFPAGIRVDSAGNLYVADALNHRIRKIDASGNVTTIAGTGTAGDGGAGPATSAALRTPFGVAVDKTGNVYIADSNNHRIKKVDTQGMITTIAGTGAAGFSGDGGPAISAQLNFPLGLALDSTGNLYVADSSNARIRKITPAGFISTFAGGSTGNTLGDEGPATQARLINPQDVAVGPDGQLYILDPVPTQQGTVTTVRRVDNAGIIHTAATPPVGLAAGLALDSSGLIYVTDGFNHRVVRMEGLVARVYAGGSVLDGGPATAAGLASPTGVKVDVLGNAYIADTANHRIRRIDSSGNIKTAAGSGAAGFAGDNGPATSALLNTPQGLAFDGDNNMYIADAGNHRIRKVTSAGLISTIAGTGAAGYTATEDGGPATKAKLSAPGAVAVDSSGNIYIADRGNRRVRKIDATGNISTLGAAPRTTPCPGTVSFSCGDNGPIAQATFADPRDLVVDPQGNLYIADAAVTLTGGSIAGGFRIRQVDTTGTIRTVAGNGQADSTGDGLPPTSAAIGVPSGIALDRSGALFLSDDRNHRVRKAVLGGVITTLAGAGTSAGFSGDGGPASAAQLSRPKGLVVDKSGNLLVADSGNHRVRRITGVGLPTGRQMVLVSGNNQSGKVAAVLTQPLVVAILDGGSPVEGVAVQFTASPAVAVDFDPAQMATNASGQAATNVTLKGNPGLVTVTASAAGLESVPFKLTALPSLNDNGAVNGASFDTTAPLAPGTIASLFGQGLSDTGGPFHATALPLPTKLGNSLIRIQAGSRTLTAPLFFVSPQQVNFLVPFEITDTSINLVLNGNDQDSAPLPLNIVDASPGVFTLSQTGSGPGAVLHADFNPVSASNPARQGETLLVFCTGLGPVTPPVQSGLAAPADPLSRTNTVPDVLIGGVKGTVDFAGLAPGFAGLYQVNVQVPAGVAAGPEVSLALSVGARKAKPVTIAVQ